MLEGREEGWGSKSYMKIICFNFFKRERVEDPFPYPDFYYFNKFLVILNGFRTKFCILIICKRNKYTLMIFF